MSDVDIDAILQRIVDENLQKVLPKPRKGESRRDFVSRCMANSEMRQEFPDQSQRAAVCFRQSRR